MRSVGVRCGQACASNWLISAEGTPPIDSGWFTAIPQAEQFHPGVFLKEELEARGWSQEHFAEITGYSLRTINFVICGRLSVSARMAAAFEKALGSSAEYWLRLQSLYDSHE